MAKNINDGDNPNPAGGGVLFVCTGNICRSPTAEAILRKMTGGKVRVDSAGISNYHSGQMADYRARDAADRYGYKMDDIRARQVCPDDFYNFATIYAMDSGHYEALKQLRPKDATAKIERFAKEDIPDPYYTGGFGKMMELLEEGCRRIAKGYGFNNTKD